LGYMYKNGEGVSQDYTKALDWYTKAAEQGFAKAQYNLGLIYVEGGEGIPQDYNKGLDWLTKAAEQGLAEAQANWGIM